MHSDISVLLPVHGKCNYLDSTLSSVYENTLQPLEVLVINDGIEQEYIKIIDKYMDKGNLRFIKNQGKGLVSALNTGLLHAKGVYVARIDSDDLMAPNRMELQRELFKQNSELVVVGSQCTYINSKSEVTGVSQYPVGIVSNLEKFQKECLIAHPSTMYRLSAAKSIGGYRSVFNWDGVEIAEDFDFWLRLQKFGQIINLNTPLTSYRQHPEQLSSKYKKGTQIGTIFIIAINRMEDTKIKEIHFQNNKCQNLFDFVFIIFSNLGFLYASVLLIDIWMLNLKVSKSNRFIRHIFNYLYKKLLNNI